ncbi:MAG: methionyl-tRNA formyltransferase [Caldilineaceae bacterium]
MSENKIRTIYMGTPEFAVPSLRLLSQQSWIEIIGVLTQPDRPAGRGNRLVASPVKQFALEQGFHVLQPTSLRKDPQTVAAIQTFAPDLIVVAAYGLILPKSVLAIPRFGCVNVHGSILPAYRGASPIAAAILDGKAESGISIMLMDEGMDTGPVLRIGKTPILSDETAASLTVKLAELGANLLLETLPGWIDGMLRPTPQQELPGEVTTCGRIEKEAGEIDWQQPAIHIERMTRAYTPWPSAYTFWKGESFKIWQAEVVRGETEPGRVVALGKEVAVGTGDALLKLKLVQPAGKKAMDLRSFLNGAPGFVGSLLGQEDKETGS